MVVTAASGRLVSYTQINSVVVDIDRIDRIWARGDITGTYLADWIYEVTAYGQVTATMTVADSLWSLRALGDIAGTFTAGVAIGDVRTGGTADFAVFIAPSFPGVVEGTRAGFMTYPEAPLPRVGEFFADAADAYREVLAAQEDLQAAGTALVQQTTAAIGEVGRAISQAGERLLEIYAEAGGRMDNAKALQQQRFEDVQRDIQREFGKAGIELEQAQRGVENAVDLAFKQAQRPIDDRKAELSTGSRQAAHEKAFHQQVSASMVQSKADEYTATTLQLTVDQGLRPERWNEEMREMGNQMLDNLQLALDIAGTGDPTPISDGINTLISAARGRWQEAAFNAVSMIPYAGDAIGKAGKLAWKASHIAKALKFGADAGTTLAKKALAVAGNPVAKFNQRALCKSPNPFLRVLGGILRQCFVGDTQVLIAELDLGQSVVQADAESSTSDYSRAILASTCVLVGMAGAYKLAQKRKRRLRDAERRELDSIFAQDNLSDLFQRLDGFHPTAIDNQQRQNHALPRHRRDLIVS